MSSTEKLPEAAAGAGVGGGGGGAVACDKEMPGVPPNPLPFWVSFPLRNKLPVPSVMPRGALFMHACRMGDTVRSVHCCRFTAARLQ